MEKGTEESLPESTEISEELEKKYKSEQRRCRRLASYALESSPMLNYLLRAMDERGCRLADQFVACVPMPEMRILGGYEIDKRRVVLNSVTATDQKTVTRTLVHELIHAFDICRVKFDSNNCRHLACTEIRAANLSDDCAFSAELWRGNWNFRAGQRKCVHRRATLSIQDSKACQGQNAALVVGSVFRRCYRDTAPFPGVPE